MSEENNQTTWHAYVDDPDSILNVLTSLIGRRVYISCDRSENGETDSFWFIELTGIIQHQGGKRFHVEFEDFELSSGFGNQRLTLTFDLESVRQICSDATEDGFAEEGDSENLPSITLFSYIGDHNLIKAETIQEMKSSPLTLFQIGLNNRLDEVSRRLNSLELSIDTRSSDIDRRTVQLNTSFEKILDASLAVLGQQRDKEVDTYSECMNCKRPFITGKDEEHQFIFIERKFGSQRTRQVLDFCNPCIAAWEWSTAVTLDGNEYKIVLPSQYPNEIMP